MKIKRMEQLWPTIFKISNAIKLISWLQYEKFKGFNASFEFVHQFFMKIEVGRVTPAIFVQIVRDNGIIYWKL